MNWHEYFTYNAETGNLIWKKRSASMFSSLNSCKIWNTRFSGTIAGCINNSSKRTNVLIGGKMRAAHRIIWEMHNGPIPDGLVIDHINQDPHDNRLSNLRLATVSQNNSNSHAKCKNPFGYKGVSRVRKNDKWLVVVSVNGKSKRIGEFTCIHDAAEAYNVAARGLYGEFSKQNNIQQPR